MPNNSRSAASISVGFPPHSCALDWLSAATDKLCKMCNFAGFIRRTLSVVGWPMHRILLAGICDDESAGAALRMALAEWLSAGAPSCLGGLWCSIHAALLHRCTPEMATAACGNGWWYAVVLAGIAKAIHFFRDVWCRTRMRLALRCFPPAMQWCLWRQEFRGELLGFRYCLFATGLAPCRN